MGPKGTDTGSLPTHTGIQPILSHTTPGRIGTDGLIRQIR
jgi:hypothetical protein